MNALLELNDVTVSFSGLVAVDHLSMTVREGLISALVGPNGAGKTTAFNAVTGLTPLTAGSVTFDGQPLNGLQPFKRAQLGLARTFQGIRLFPTLSVLDNIRAGLYQKTRSGLLASVVRTRSQQSEERDIIERSLESLRIVNPALAPRYGEEAQSLPYGLQRHVEIARALVSQPKLLLLDEPAAGLNTAERAELLNMIHRLREQGLTVWLIEHDVELVGRISDEVVVIDHGVAIAHGNPDDTFANPAVVEAYLGVADEEAVR